MLVNCSYYLTGFDKISVLRDIILPHISTVCVNGIVLYLNLLYGLLRYITDKTLCVNLVNGTHAVIGLIWLPVYLIWSIWHLCLIVPHLSFSCLSYAFTEGGSQWPQKLQFYGFFSSTFVNTVLLKKLKYTQDISFFWNYIYIL